MILFLVGASGVHIGCCLNPLEVCVWWLDCLLLKEGASAFCTLGDCLKCFLLLRSLWLFAQAVGFHLNDCIEYFTAPGFFPSNASWLSPGRSTRSVPKNGTVKVLFFCSFIKLNAVPKWDRQAVPFLGPCLGSFFEVFLYQGCRSATFWFQ